MWAEWFFPKSQYRFDNEPDIVLKCLYVQLHCRYMEMENTTESLDTHHALECLWLGEDNSWYSTEMESLGDLLSVGACGGNVQGAESALHAIVTDLLGLLRLHPRTSLYATGFFNLQTAIQYKLTNKTGIWPYTLI